MANLGERAFQFQTVDGQIIYVKLSVIFDVRQPTRFHAPGTSLKVTDL